MNNALVSIIVPIYNVEKYLDRCLLSIRNQTYSNIEVIMVNDGSKDSSRSIALNYQTMDARFVLVDKENGGLSSARNNGMKYVHGEFVSFIDSDDFLATDYVEKLLNGFENRIDIVIGDYVIFNSLTEKTYMHGQLLKEEIFRTIDEKKELLQKLFSGYPVMSVWKNMYRVSFLLENKLEFASERLVYAEDKLFHVEAYSLASGIKIIPDIVFYHLIVPGSLSQGYRKTYYKMNKELYLEIDKILKKYYDRQFVKLFEQTISDTIGASLLALCKCGFSEALGNIKEVLSDELVKESYDNKLGSKGYFRYWILYKLGKFNSAVLVTFCAKLMIIANPVYRLIQRHTEYKASK